MNYHLFLYSSLLFLVPILARAQSPLEADAFALRYDSTHAEVEIEYGTLQHALNFKSIEGTQTAYTYAKAEIWQNGKISQEKDIRDTVHCPCTQSQMDSAGANVLLGVTAFAVPYYVDTLNFAVPSKDKFGLPLSGKILEGSSVAAAYLWNTGEKNGVLVFDTIVIPLLMPIPDTSKFVLGGVELASQVEKSNGSHSPFEKAGYIVTPNPSGIFGENYSKLYYYTELYVPKAAVDPGQSAVVTTSVIDPSGSSIVSSTDNVPLAGTTIPLILGLDIDGLASDSYRLRIQVKYQDAVVAQTEKIFYYASDITLSQAPPAAPASLSADSILFAGSEFAKLTNAEADELTEQSMYWGDDADKQQAAKQSTLDDKQHFLFSFWREQDAKHHAAQPLDEFRIFETRVASADQQYVSMKTPGWKTGRGRVLITYGSPKYVTDEYYQAGYKPYIVWQYDADPNLRLRTGDRAEFDFVDRTGGGNFALVSSTVIGENYDPNWISTEALQLAH